MAAKAEAPPPGQRTAELFTAEERAARERAALDRPDAAYRVRLDGDHGA